MTRRVIGVATRLRPRIVGTLRGKNDRLISFGKIAGNTLGCLRDRDTPSWQRLRLFLEGIEIAKLGQCRAITRTARAKKCNEQQGCRPGAGPHLLSPRAVAQRASPISFPVQPSQLVPPQLALVRSPAGSQERRQLVPPAFQLPQSAPSRF